jgi:hypothetical protein
MRRKERETQMNKIKIFGMGAALIGSLFCMRPITAYAGGYDCSCETKCTEDCVDEDCPVCKEDYHNCEGAEPEPEKEEHWGPLTPDGNMTIVDDYGSLEAGGKQFITVVTKNGNYFYIIIDRDDDGKETVHFLNMVDESDLLSLMDEDQVNDYIAITKGKSTKEEEVKPVVPEPEPVKEEPEPEEPKKPVNVNGIMAIILLLALAGAGGYMYFTTTKHTKKKPKKADPDKGYVEEPPLNLPVEKEKEIDVNVSAEDIKEAEESEKEAKRNG